MINLGNSIPRNGLVFEGLLDGNALDTSGNGNNGTAYNMTYIKTTKGYQSQAGSFNGSSSYISIADNGSLDLTTEYGMFVEINMSSLPSSGNLYALIDKNYGGNGWEFELRNDNGIQKIFVSHWNASTTATYLINYTLPINQFILLGATYSGTEINFWLNNTIIGTVTGVNKTCGIGTSVLEIGRSVSLGARYYNGKMQSARIYNRALVQDEVELLVKEMNRKLGPSNIASYPKLMDGLVGYFDFKGDASNLVDGVKATVAGATLTTDRFGYANSAYKFYGTSYIGVGLTIPFGSKTISFYSKMDGATGTKIIFDSLSGRIIIGRVANKWGIYNTTSGWQIFSSSPKIGVWELITIVLTPTSAILYIDGIYDSTITYSPVAIGGTTRIGNYNDSTTGEFAGELSQFMFYSRILSADEVKLLYDLTSSDYIYPAPSYDLSSLRDGLVAEYNGANNGTTWYDTSGNGNNGTGTAITMGRQGKAKTMGFNGSSSKVSLPSGAYSTFNGTNERTFSCWFKKSTVSGNHNIISINTSFSAGNPKILYITSYGTNISVQRGNDVNTEYTGTLSANIRYNLVVTRISSTNTTRIYLDGKLVTENNSDNANTTGAGIGHIGVWTEGSAYYYYFNGNIQLSRIYNRVLSAKEIQALYYSQKGSFIY